MPALNAQHLRKSFGPQVVLDDATFTLARGEKVALIGANGAGKSTLAKILAGQEPADGGNVAVRRGLTISYLAQEPALDPDKSARAIVEDALTAWRAAIARHGEVTKLLETTKDVGKHDALVTELSELDDTIHRHGGWDRGHVALDMLHRLGVDEVERPAGERSGGERRRIAIARLLVARPDVAILDEPTNHLDAETAEWLESHLAREFPGAIILVTHDRYFLDAIATRIVELERGRLTSYDGGYGDYLDKKATLLEHEERTEKNRQNILRREREWLSRGPKARTTKQKARIQRAAILEGEVPANIGRGEQIKLSTTSSRQGKTILECRALSLSVPDQDRLLVEPFDLFVTAGERIGVIGPNGVGKTTFLRALRSEVPPRSGEIIVGKNTDVAYLDQARAGIDDDKSIFDDVKGETGSTVVTLGKETMDLRSYLELFLFDAGKQRQKCGALSGGERARVALAKMLKRGANLLMFDEPTNDLDLPTLSALEELLVDYPGCAIVVTHDRAFLDRVATAILSFEKVQGGETARVERHAGGFSDYLMHKEAMRDEARAKTAATTEAKRVATAPPPKPKGLTYAERLELEAILDRIDAAEKEASALEALLADPSLYATRGGEVAALTTKLEGARADAAKLVARWEELESKKAAAK